jgi:uncharacterized membrane protein YfcA
MAESLAIAVIAGTFLLAGAVKGVIGLGLPTVSLGLLTAALDLRTAMALLIVPSFVTNLWQAAAGGSAREILARIWPFLLAATATVWLGALALTRVDASLLSGLLGALLALYAAVSLSGLRFAIPARGEAWAGPLFGAANGILTGMTGSFVVPGVMYLQSIGLPRDRLVQAMGMLFTASTVALAAALQDNDLLGAHLGLMSAAAVIPAVAGMVAGQRVRRSLSEEKYRRIFFVAVLALGAGIIARAAFGSRP